MNISDKTASWLVALFIALIILLVSLNVNADKLSVYDDKNHHYDELVKGDKGEDGRDGISIKGDAGRDGFNGSNYDDNALTQAMSISAAMASMPSLSHVDAHTHTGGGMSVGNYRNSTAIAVGFIHQKGNKSFKSMIGTSGGEVMTGAGMSITW